MNGIDPYAYMQQVAVKMEELMEREEIERYSMNWSICSK